MTTDNSSAQYIWAVTRSINQYDQDGDYFVGFFYEKPTAAQLANLTGRSIEYWVTLNESNGEDEFSSVYVSGDGLRALKEALDALPIDALPTKRRGPES